MPVTPPTQSTSAGQQNLQFTITVDAKTGNLVVKDFNKLLQQLQQQYSQVNQSGQNNNNSNNNQAQGWANLAAKTFFAVEAMKGFVAMAKATVVESTLLAARIEVLNTVTVLTARNMNYSTGQAYAQVEAIRKLNITHQEAINTTLQFMRAQLNLADAQKVARVAQDLAVVSGQNSSEALGTIIEAIQTQREVLLRQFGIVKTLPQIYDLYASSVNRSAASLTTLEKEQAVLNVVLMEGQKVSGAYALAMGDAGKQLTSIPRLIADLKEQVGTGFIPILGMMVRGFSELLAFLKLIPPGVYVIVGSLTILVGAVGSAYASMRLFTASLVQADIVSKATGASLVGMAGKLSLIGLALSAIGAGYVYYLSVQEGANKATIEHSRTLQGEAAQVATLLTAYNNLQDQKKRLSALDSGAAATQSEKGIYDFIDEKSKQILAVERLRAQVKANENQLLNEAKALHLDIFDVIGKEADGTEKLRINQEKLLALQRQKKENAAQEIPLIEKRIEVNKKDLEQQIADRERLRKQVLNQDVLTGKQAHQVPVIGDLIRTIDLHNLEEADKKIKELQAAIKALHDEEDALKNSNASGIQLVPINLEVQGQALEHVQALLAKQRALIQSNAGVTKQEAEAFDLAMKATLSFYEGKGSVLTNLQNRLQNLQKEGASQTAIQKAAEDLNYTIKARQKVKDIIESSLPPQQKTSALIKQEMQDYIHLAQNAGIYGNIVNGLQQLEESGMSIHQQAQDAANQATVRGLEFEKAKIQQQLSFLSQMSKTSEQLEHQLELERQVADIDAQITSTQNGLAAATAGVTAETIKTTKAIEANRAATEALIQASLHRLSAEESITGVYGASAAKQLEILHRRTAEEISQIRNTTATREVQEAQITAKIAEEWAKRIEIERAAEDQRLSLARTINNELATVTETRIQQGRGDSTDVSRLNRLADEQKKINLETFRNREFLRIAETQGIKAAMEALASYSALLDAQTEEKKLQNRLNSMQVAFEKENELTDLRQRANLARGGTTSVEVDGLRQIRELHQQILLLKERFPELANQLDVQERAIVADLKEQTELQKIKAQFDAASRVQDMANNGEGISATASRRASEMQVDAATRSAEAMRQLNQELENGDITWSKYAEQVALAGNTTLTFEQALEGMSHGIFTQAQALAVMKYGFQALGEAALKAFDAIGRGDKASKVMRDFGSEIFKTMAKFAMKKAVFYWGAAAADALAMEWEAAARHAGAATLWTAAAAGLGIAGGAVSGSGGGSGGGGGGTPTASPTPGEPGGRASNLQKIEPVATKTNTDDMMVRLENELIISGRQLADAGTQLNALGGQFYAFTKLEEQLAASKHDAERIFADQEAKVYQLMLNQGASQDQWNAFFADFLKGANDLMGQNHETTDALTQLISDQMVTSIDPAKNGNKDITDILTRVHGVLQDIFHKDTTPVVNPTITLDGQEISGALVDGGYVGTGGGTPSAMDLRNNAGRRDIGLALAKGGL